WNRVANTIAAHPPTSTSELELNFLPDLRVYDGRFANNAWLQELPDPISKQEWGNSGWMSPATAAQLGLRSDDLVELRWRNRTLQVPIQVIPGHADGSISLPLGYGRGGDESNARGHGFDAYRIRTSDAPWFSTGAELVHTGQRDRTVRTQDHFVMEDR